MSYRTYTHVPEDPVPEGFVEIGQKKDLGYDGERMRVSPDILVLLPFNAKGTYCQDKRSAVKLAWVPTVGAGMYPDDWLSAKYGTEECDKYGTKQKEVIHDF